MPTHRLERMKKKRALLKKPMGRPPHIPTEQQRSLVRSLNIAGWPRADIASVLDIGLETLLTSYDDELDKAKATVDAMVTRTIVMKATGGPEGDWQKADLVAAIFFAKTQMGWREPPTININGTYDLSSIATQDLEDIRAKLAKAIPAQISDDRGDRRGAGAAGGGFRARER